MHNLRHSLAKVQQPTDLAHCSTVCDSKHLLLLAQRPMNCCIGNLCCYTVMMAAHATTTPAAASRPSRQ
jgi:hypothetical protein